MQFHQFGSEAYPLRVSSLPYLLRCPGRVLMIALAETQRSSNAAADTGTAAHLGIAEYHRGKDTEAALATMRDRLGEFPLADAEQAEKYLRAYTRDPRNTRDAVTDVEVPVAFTLPPHPADPTGAQIYLTGTLDQVRPCGSSVLEVWDYKTGQDDGWTMLHEFAVQLSGYSLGGRRHFHQHVVPGGIIRARGYFARGKSKEASPPGVFYEAGLSEDAIEVLMNKVRLCVANLRRGYLDITPGAYCAHCPHGGLGDCVNLGRGFGLV